MLNHGGRLKSVNGVAGEPILGSVESAGLELASPEEGQHWSWPHPAQGGRGPEEFFIRVLGRTISQMIDTGGIHFLFHDLFHD